MLIPKSWFAPRVFGYYALLAGCAILICVEIWVYQDTVVSAVPMILRPTSTSPTRTSTSLETSVQEPTAIEDTVSEDAVSGDPVLGDPVSGDPVSNIPKILWYKLGRSRLNEATRQWTDSCIKANPSYRAAFMTDEDDDEWVRRTFAFRPDIVDVYTRFQVPIFKADMLRYLLLFDQGGVWSDLDISCEGVPIDDWIPAEYKPNTGLVVGWEFDVGWPGEYTRQFTSWTIMSKPKSVHMMQVIDDILATLHEKMSQGNFTVEGASLENMGDVVDFTGPRRLTFSIYTSLGKQLNRTIEVDDIKEITQPKLVGDVLIMPGRSFAASANTYQPEDEPFLPPQLVTHHYAGTWKNDHGGERKRRLK